MRITLYLKYTFHIICLLLWSSGSMPDVSGNLEWKLFSLSQIHKLFENSCRLLEAGKNYKPDFQQLFRVLEIYGNVICRFIVKRVNFLPKSFETLISILRFIQRYFTIHWQTGVLSTRENLKRQHLLCPSRFMLIFWFVHCDGAKYATLWK